jgi:GTPase Era involved in 16S rRNA processing
MQFRVMVEDENVQRMVIGKQGQNINWVRDHFKTNYAKIYSK